MFYHNIIIIIHYFNRLLSLSENKKIFWKNLHISYISFHFLKFYIKRFKFSLVFFLSGYIILFCPVVILITPTYYMYLYILYHACIYYIRFQHAPRKRRKTCLIVTGRKRRERINKNKVNNRH